MLIMPDCVSRGGSRRVRGPGFGRRGGRFSGMVYGVIHHPLLIKVSRPEEFHLQPLAESDRNVSAHPAPIIQPYGFVIPKRSSCLHSWHNGMTQMTRFLRSSLITRPSSLLQIAPPLNGALVLLASLFTLAPFPLHRQRRIL